MSLDRNDQSWGNSLTGGRVKRRLAAVLAADVAGYSRLMGMDEEGTLARLKSVRKSLVDPAIASHRGRIVKTTGDGILVEFASAVDAVRGALQVQRDMGDQNASVPQDQKIEFRIGIHVGDIIIDENDIFGDGVNIAARLEAIAEPGGVCLSDDAYRQVRGKIEIVWYDLGPQTFKNIAEPMRAWRNRLGGRTPATAQTGRFTIQSTALALPDKPSIAVLPFQNMSGDLEQEYFADGMVEEIITALSRFKLLFIIARNSSFTYKGKVVDVKQVGRELGVHYVLEGSVRKGGDRVRITGQLIDAATGSHLWADRFEGSMENIFELQDSVATSVVGAIVPQVMFASAEQVARKPADNLDGYDRYLRGMSFAYKRTLEGNRQALAEFEIAISLDPFFAPAYAQFAFCKHNQYYNFLHAISEDERRVAIRAAYRAVELAPADDALSLGLAAFVVGNLDNDLEGGLGLANRSIAINPNYANAYTIKAYLSALLGNTADVGPAADYAVRLNPLDVGVVIAAIRTHLTSSAALRQYEETAAWARKLLSLDPNDVHGLVMLNVEAFRRGDSAEADRLHSRVQALYPHLRKEHLRKMYLRYRDPAHQAALAERISWATLPE